MAWSRPFAAPPVAAPLPRFAPPAAPARATAQLLLLSDTSSSNGSHTWQRSVSLSFTYLLAVALPASGPAWQQKPGLPPRRLRSVEGSWWQAVPPARRAMQPAVRGRGARHARWRWQQAWEWAEMTARLKGSGAVGLGKEDSPADPALASGAHRRLHHWQEQEAVAAAFRQRLANRARAVAVNTNDSRTTSPRPSPTPPPPPRVWSHSFRAARRLSRILCSSSADLRSALRCASSMKRDVYAILGA